MTQPGLPLGVVAAPEIGDPRDRCYTPQPLADGVAQWVAEEMGEECDSVAVIVEPSVGGGAFVRACRKLWPDALIIGVDIDPRAHGLNEVDEPMVMDWSSAVAQIADLYSVDLVIGNPPFSRALEQWGLAPSRLPEAHQALLMPWAYPGVQSWGPALREAPLTALRPIEGRPWPKRVRETGVYYRAPGQETPTTRETQARLVLPAIAW